MRVAVVTAAMKSGERGGAEAFYAGLVGGLRSFGVDADQVDVPIDESSFDAVLSSYDRCYDLDLRQYDLVISTKAPTYMLRHPRHVSYLVHTLRVFYDRFASEFGAGTEAAKRQRALIHQLDKAALHPDRVRRHFTIGHTNYRRLIDADAFWNRIPYEVLYPPASVAGFKPPRPGQYFFVPGRLHRWKRTDLVIRAMQRLRRDIPLKIAGTGEDEQQLRALAAGDRRIQFLGRVTDEQLVDLFAGAIAVPFVPVQEDYGLVMIEAFKSRKPVVTCLDSGEPVYFVKDGVNGLVVEPTSDALAAAFESLIDRPERAVEMGENGFQSVGHIGWESIASALVNSIDGTKAKAGARTRESARPAVRATDTTRLNVVVLDMQPIEPAVGGGRLRLLGLYHNLGEQVATTYVGTYDWRGPGYRDHQLTPTLREIDVPLSDGHFAASDEWRRLTGGKTVIDASFPLLGHLSPQYVEAARAGACDADVVVCSHPWVYPLVRDVLGRPGQMLIYDAHNVESVLRYRLLGDSDVGLRIVRHGTAVERELCRRADLVLTCSHEDRDLFHRLYGIPFAKCLVMANGTFVGEAPSDLARCERKRQLGLDGKPLAMFIGSLYPPNEEAARFICTDLAPAFPDVTFAICGGVGTAIDCDALARQGIANVRVTGVIDDAARRGYLGAADVAVNPMFSGSGTNIKMFDFMAAGLPVISTPTGARGINLSGSALHVCAPNEFTTALRRILDDREYARQLGTAARQVACDSYAWERLSPRLGRLLTRHRRTTSRVRPRFTVVVPTYERQGHLPKLLDCLVKQTCRDFEVILVDQSASPWKVPARYSSSLDIVYEHSEVKGTSRARNLGAWLARGELLAFTDDDCQPEPDWLKNAARYFEAPRVAGVEGLVVSDRLDDPDYRPVTNVGFEGIGFMTANLLLRHDVFNAIDGFDEQFDVPFREDTDLGWRACTLGEIPFGHDVRVFHPPHLRSVEREAHASRVRFFEKDALLLKKHPDRYKSLFLKEAHYRKTPGFGEHFVRGSVKYGVPIDDFYSNLLAGPSAGHAVTVRVDEKWP